MSNDLLCLFTRDSCGAWGARTPAKFLISYFDVLRQYTHVLAGELPLPYNFRSFFVANQFVSSFELSLLYAIKKL